MEEYKGSKWLMCVKHLEKLESLELLKVNQKACGLLKTHNNQERDEAIENFNKDVRKSEKFEIEGWYHSGWEAALMCILRGFDNKSKKTPLIAPRIEEWNQIAVYFNPNSYKVSVLYLAE